MTQHEMEFSLHWLQEHRPSSTLIPLYQLALTRGARVHYDTMWRLWWRGLTFDVGNVRALLDILNGPEP